MSGLFLYRKKLSEYKTFSELGNKLLFFVGDKSVREQGFCVYEGMGQIKQF